MQTNAMGRLGPVPVIGIGTWNSERAPAADLERAVHRAIELGAHHVDTAEMYGRGVVEERLGKALAGKPSFRGQTGSPSSLTSYSCQVPRSSPPQQTSA